MLTKELLSNSERKTIEHWVCNINLAPTIVAGGKYAYDKSFGAGSIEPDPFNTDCVLSQYTLINLTLFAVSNSNHGIAFAFADADPIVSVEDTVSVYLAIKDTKGNYLLQPKKMSSHGDVTFSEQYVAEFNPALYPSIRVYIGPSSTPPPNTFRNNATFKRGCK